MRAFIPSCCLLKDYKTPTKDIMCWSTGNKSGSHMAQLISPVALKQFVTLKKDHVTVAFTSHKPTGVWTSVPAEELFDRDKTVTKLVLCTFLHGPQMALLPLHKHRTRAPFASGSGTWSSTVEYSCITGSWSCVTGAGAQFVECLSHMKPLCAVLMHSCNPSTCEAEAEGSGVKGHLQPHSERLQGNLSGKNGKRSGSWWCAPLIPALRRQRLAGP